MMSSSPHILVVDDHRQIRESVTRFLEKNGMRATAAKDAVEMDAQLASGHYDLLVLDVMMPGEDGLSVCRRLARQSSLPIIMLTAATQYSRKPDDYWKNKVGVEDYISKPFEPVELLNRVDKVLKENYREKGDGLGRFKIK